MRSAYKILLCLYEFCASSSTINICQPIGWALNQHRLAQPGGTDVWLYSTVFLQRKRCMYVLV